MNGSEENRKDEKIGISLAGAVDLSALKAKNKKAEGPQEKENFSYVLDVSFASVESYAPASATYPILLLIYGEGSEGFAKDLAKEVERQKGKVQLLRINASLDPDEAAAMDLSTLPALFVMIKGQLLPLFEGPLNLDASQSLELAKGSVEAALQAAAEEGVTGTAPRMGKAKKEEEEEEGEEEKSIYFEADKLLKEGEFEKAAQEYKRIASQNPADKEAACKAAKAELIARVKKMDPASVREGAAKDPKDLQAQLGAADLDFYAGHVEDAIGRLLDYISSFKDPEGKAKDRILDYISMLPAGDPRVKSARMKLASALY